MGIDDGASVGAGLVGAPVGTVVGAALVGNPVGTAVGSMVGAEVITSMERLA